MPVIQTGTPALPTGAATETTLAAVKTSVELIDNAISGSEMQVDIVASLPAGTNNIGDVDIVSSVLPTGAATAALQTQPGVDIGDVTINNASGAAAVNIQDGGNSITVDGSITANLGTIAGVATETTLSSLLTELQLKADLTETQPVSVASLPLPSGAATEAKQDTGNSSLATIAGLDFATQTTLAAILAKILIAPSTEAKQDTGNASLTTIAAVDFATQTTLAAILAKIIAAPATEAKQDTGNTSLGSIDTKLTSQATAANQSTQITALNYLNREEAFNSQVDSGNANITYFGYAAIGTATSAAAWKIFKLDETTGTVKKWADGNNSYDNVFDNREALTYV